MDKDPEEIMTYSLDPILQYEMTSPEAKAFKVCLLWMKSCERTLGKGYNYARIPKNGDPRKCHLFRMAWKLLRESGGILADSDLCAYIRAQLEILTGIRKGSGHALIDPACLCGEKAWIRWRMYQRRLARSERELNQVRGEATLTPLHQIAGALERTRVFLERFFQGSPGGQDFAEMVRSGNLRRWVALGKVSPYYVLLSPGCRDSLAGIDRAGYFGNAVDLDLYSPDITPEAVAAFASIFPKEEGVR